MKILNTNDIGQILGSDPHTSRDFIGVFAADKTPRTLTRFPCSMVFNTDIASKPGEHWVSVFIDVNGYGEFFDSFGLQPQSEFLELMNNHCKAWVSNKQMVQNVMSSACGYYCIAHIHTRSKLNLSMFQFVNLFDNNLLNNDRRVIKYVRSRMFSV